MSATALSILFLLSIVLMVESCIKIHDVHTTHGFPTSDDSNNDKEDPNKDHGSGPVPPHPFKRSVGSLDVPKLNNFITIKIQELFDDLDGNSDGLVTVTEWTRRKAGVTEFARILRNFDTNADDALSFEEFLAATSYS